MLSMVVVGILVKYFDSCLLLACGFGILGYSTLLLRHINLGISMASLALPNLINGFASGFIFVPLTTMTMGRLRREEVGNAAGISARSESAVTQSSARIARVDRSHHWVKTRNLVICSC